MSSKLVKKGLDFVCSTSDSLQEKRRKSQKNKKCKARKRKVDASCQNLSPRKKGKMQEKDDFTDQNLKYFKHKAWSINKDTYKKIVHHQDKMSRKEDNQTTEDRDEEDDDLY